MRQRVFAGIGVVWGGLILVRRLFAGPPTGSNAYAAGQIAGVVVGALLFGVGLYYLVRKQSAK